MRSKEVDSTAERMASAGLVVSFWLPLDRAVLVKRSASGSSQYLHMNTPTFASSQRLLGSGPRVDRREGTAAVLGGSVTVGESREGELRVGMLDGSARALLSRSASLRSLSSPRHAPRGRLVLFQSKSRLESHSKRTPAGP